MGNYYFDMLIPRDDQWTLNTYSVQHPIYHNVRRLDSILPIFTTKNTNFIVVMLRDPHQDLVSYTEDAITTLFL